MPQFRVIQPTNNYPGLTAIALPNGNEIVSMGIGPEVEQALLEARDGRNNSVEVDRDDG